MSIIHDHNTRSKKQLSFEDAMVKMESNILEQISSLKVDVRSMKDTLEYEQCYNQMLTR